MCAVSSKSFFSPQGNSAPDLLTIETSFNVGGKAVAVDKDLSLRVCELGGTDLLPVITKDTTPAIQTKIAGGGIYYYVRLDPTTFGNCPVEAKWFAKIEGKQFCPYPQKTVINTQSSVENVLLHSEVKDWVLRKLGFPKISIELDECQILDNIEDTIADYSENIPLFKYGKIDLVSGRKAYDIPEFGRGILDVQFRRREGNPIVSDPLFGRDYPRYTNLDFDHYVLATSFYETLLRTTGQDPIWRWEDCDPNTLFLDTGDSLRTFYLVSYVYSVSRRLEDIPPEHHERFKRMVLARTKIVLGEVREKFGDSVITPGGQVQLNGGKLKDEGQTQLDKLQEELRLLRIPMWPIIAG